MHCNKFIVILVIAVLAQINALPNLSGYSFSRNLFAQSKTSTNGNQYSHPTPLMGTTDGAASIGNTPAAPKPSWMSRVWKNMIPGAQKQSAPTTGPAQLASVPKKTLGQKFLAELSLIGSAAIVAGAPHVIAHKFGNKPLSTKAMLGDVGKAIGTQSLASAKKLFQRTPKDVNIA